MIDAGNPLKPRQAIPVLLAVLLNNPNLKDGALRTGAVTGLYHTFLKGAALNDFESVDRSNREYAIEWLAQRREQARDDAVRIAQQHCQSTGSTHWQPSRLFAHLLQL